MNKCNNVNIMIGWYYSIQLLPILIFKNGRIKAYLIYFSVWILQVIQDLKRHILQVVGTQTIGWFDYSKLFFVTFDYFWLSMVLLAIVNYFTLGYLCLLYFIYN
jgi:hypothetical protein